MADTINLRQARKAKARAEKDLQAAGNRAKFGEAKSDKQVRKANARLEAEKLAAKKLDR